MLLASKLVSAFVFHLKEHWSPFQEPLVYLKFPCPYVSRKQVAVLNNYMIVKPTHANTDIQNQTIVQITFFESQLKKTAVDIALLAKKNMGHFSTSDNMHN